MEIMEFRGVDYLHIDSLFSEQELLVRQTARRFVDERVVPLVRDCFRQDRFPSELIGQMADLGFLGANLEGYGCAGMSNVEYAAIALWCWKQGFQPRGNSQFGRSSDATSEVGVRSDGLAVTGANQGAQSRTLTGCGSSRRLFDE